MLSWSEGEEAQGTTVRLRIMLPPSGTWFKLKKFKISSITSQTGFATQSNRVSTAHNWGKQHTKRKVLNKNSAILQY
jgi:hypothetical protein